MDHEDVLTYTEIEFGGDYGINDLSHLHEIKEVIAGGTDNSGAKLGKKEKERRNDVHDTSAGRCLVKKVAPVN